MKKILFIAIVIVLAFSTATAYGADEITVYVNGMQVVSDAPAVVVSGTTMLPFRSIFNALGISDDSITWNPDSKCIEVNSGSKYIFLVIGSTGAVSNDALITLNAAPYIENGRTYVPVRFVSETLGADVQWNVNTKTVTITKK